MIITNNLPAARGLIAHVLVRTGPRDTIDTGFTIVVGSIALQISSIDQTKLAVLCFVYFVNNMPATYQL